MTKRTKSKESTSNTDLSYKSPESKRIIEAIECDRIFKINGNFPIIRMSLLRRDWIEKSAPFSTNSMNVHEKYLKWQLLKKIQQKSEHFIWQPKLSDPILSRQWRSQGG